VNITKKLITGFLILSVLVAIEGYSGFLKLMDISRPLSKEIPSIINDLSRDAEMDGQARLILYYDEVLTQSVRNFAFTQNPMWEHRYFAFEPLLDTAIQQFTDHGDEEDKNIFKEIAQANVALVSMEHDAIQQVKKSNPSKAISIMESSQYRDQKGIYSKGLDQYFSRRGVQHGHALESSIVTVRIAAKNAHEQLRLTLRWTVLFVLIFFLIATAIGIFITRSIAIPIQDLIRITRLICDGDLSYRVKETHSGEIGVLSRSFNQMTDSLVQTSAQLQKSKKELERRVEERTAELVSTNEQLQRETQERRQIAENLRESETRLKIAMDLVKLVEWEYDVKTGMFSFDDRFYALYGTTSQHEGGPLMTAEAYASKFIPPEESHLVAEEIAKALATTDLNFTHQLEHRIIRADGEERHIIVRYGVVCDQTGRVVKTRGANQDITERKRAEEALRESEELYRTLVSLSPDAISVADMNGLLTFKSPKARQMFGHSPEEEILGLSIFDWVAPEEHEKVSENILHLLTDGRLKATEYTLIKKDGTRFIGEVNAAAIHSPDGSPMRMIAIIRDITERKRAQDELFNSRQMLRSVLDNIPQRVFWKDRNSIYVGCNKPLALDCGYADPSELVGKTDYDTASAATADLHRADDREVMESGKPKINYEEPQIRPDGTQAWLITSKVPTYGQDGQVIGVLGTYADITERKLAQDALRESEERFSRFFRSTPVGTSITRLSDGQIVDANDAFMGLYGYTREELIGQTRLTLQMWANSEDQAKIVEVLQKQGRMQDFETKFCRKSGEIRDALVSAEVIEVAGQQYILSLTHDFTESKQGEEKRKKLEEQLFQAQKMESVGRLAGGVAHDFNNMLGVIIGRAELALQQEVSNDKLQHNLKEILNAGLSSADLTRQLLAFARKQTAIPKVLDLNDKISGMLKMLRRLIGEDIDLSWQQGLDLWKVKIDPSQMDQILANLAVNARDAISGVGTITMRTENVVIDDSNSAEIPEFIAGQYVLLTVNDTGAGMSKEVRENIFEPFYTTKELGKGTGLGLSTVYGIVKQNDGFINVASEPGKGTTFTIYLPRFEAETAQVPSEAAAGKPPTGTETVLLVEDDKPILTLSKMILEYLDYTVLAAPTPGHAIHLVEDHPGDIHLLITDVVMPEMNGRELAEKLSAIRPNLKCLYMSGYTADVIAHRGILDEGLNFIQKPFGAVDLAAKVRQVLDRLE
jgi:two-component system, cell cycle sensor histidine kinase and response regulator CckA